MRAAQPAVYVKGGDYTPETLNAEERRVLQDCGAQIEIIPFRSDRLVFVCSPEHELARRKRLSVAELSGQRFVGFERDMSSRKAVDKILRDNEAVVQYVMEFDNIETIKRSVEAGLGVTIIPRAAVDNELRSGALRAIEFDDTFLRPIGIIHRKGKIFSAAARKFIEMLTESAALSA